MTLTREEIINQPPGIQLDQWVSVHVMGFEIRKEYLRDQSFYEFYYREGYKYENVHYPDEWQPSRFIDVAWEVEEHIAVLEKEGHYVNALCDVVGTPRDGTRVLAMDDWRMLHAKPDQRCKAALLAVLNL